MNGRDAEKRWKKNAVAVLVLAAGRGERAGGAGEGPKQYRLLAGRSVIARTLDVFRSHPWVGQIVVCIHPDDEQLFDDAVEGDKADLIVVPGGATRQASTLQGLEALQAAAPDAVMIHDAVRPFVEHTLIDRIRESLDERVGVLPALPVSDTLKRGDEVGLVTETVARDGLFAAQTPQAFPYRFILDAHRRAAADSVTSFTDDAAIAERFELPVRLIAGSPDNIKITYSADFDVANQKLATKDSRFPDVRTGNGYDVHAFTDGDAVTLCGVSIPHDRSLSGHSDADVGLHALTDALLATCGAGDIGTHFPPSDNRWKSADSRIFVRHALQIVQEHQGRISNVDITVVCEEPKVSPHRQSMVREIASMLDLQPHRVSIKATTNEKLGFLGRKEGIAALATATVVFAGSL